MPSLPAQTAPLRGLARRVTAVSALLARLYPVPRNWLSSPKNAPSGNGTGGQQTLSCKVCTEYRTMITAWRKALKWTKGLDHGLSVMLASVISTKTVGDQLWVKVMGPAACAKSTLCEALSVNLKYVIAKSTIRTVGRCESKISTNSRIRIGNVNLF